MILYNTTFCIEITSIDQFRDWLSVFYLPLIRQSGYFEEYKLLKVHHQQDPELVNYSCQLTTNTMHDGQLFKLEFEEKIANHLQATFGEKCLLFSTMLELVEEMEI